MKKLKPYFSINKIMTLMLSVIVMLVANGASAEESRGPWKPVTMAIGIEISITCRDTMISHMCYWWFRNTTDRTISFMYVIRGDGVTVDHNVPVKNGILVRKTSLTLRPHYEQPFIEGIAAQYIVATTLHEARCLTMQYDDENMSAPATDKKIRLSSPELSADSRVQSIKRTLPFCMENRKVMRDTCRCSQGLESYDPPNTNLRICRKKASKPPEHRNEDASRERTTPLDSSQLICGY